MPSLKLFARFFSSSNVDRCRTFCLSLFHFYTAEARQKQKRWFKSTRQEDTVLARSLRSAYPPTFASVPLCWCYCYAMSMLPAGQLLLVSSTALHRTRLKLSCSAGPTACWCIILCINLNQEPSPIGQGNAHDRNVPFGFLLGRVRLRRVHASFSRICKHTTMCTYSHTAHPYDAIFRPEHWFLYGDKIYRDNPGQAFANERR